MNASAPSPSALPIGALIRPADPSSPAIEIGDRLWMSEDISNSNLIGTDDGAVVINAGAVLGGPVHRARYDALDQGQHRFLVLTQSHPDHYGGLIPLLDAGTQVLAQDRFPANLAYREQMRGYYDPNSRRIWRAVLGDRQPKAPDFEVKPDILVDHTHIIELGGRRIELISTAGGETMDSLCVWLPAERIVLTGNLFGPALMTVPNLNTIRTDKPRSALEYVRSANIILALAPEKLATGHSQIVEGWDRIEQDVTRLRDAVQYIHDETVAGMNDHRSVHDLMRTIALPDHLQLSEAYGAVPWCVRTVYEEYTGWFHQDYTSRMYEVPQEAVVPELIALAGPDKVASGALAHLNAGRPVEALHLIELLLVAAPDDREALRLKARTLAALLDRAAVRQNLNETMWLRSEMLAAQTALDEGVGK